MRPIIRCTHAEYLARVAAGERGAFDISKTGGPAAKEPTTTEGAGLRRAPTHSHPGGSPRRVGGVESVAADSAPVFSK